MDTLQEMNKEYFRTDLPPLEVGDKVKVSTKIFNKNEKDKFRLTHFEGEIIAKKNPNQISYAFHVLKESAKVGIENVFSYHSPLIVSIKKFGGKPKQKVRRAKLYYLERKLAKKKDSE